MSLKKLDQKFKNNSFFKNLEETSRKVDSWPDEKKGNWAPLFRKESNNAEKSVKTIKPRKAE